MPDPLSYDETLKRLREVFARRHENPGALVESLELEDRTRDASRAALARGITFTAVCDALGRIATESLRQDRLAAISVGRTMVRWASAVYHRAAPAP